MSQAQPFKRPTVITVREAAEEAATKFAPDAINEHAKALMDSWAGVLKRATDQYTKTAIAETRKYRTGGVAKLDAEPATPTFPIPYPWWNILVAGPYQPAPLPGGPYLPHKIFQPTEPAFVLGAIWMNPAPINWFPPGPSAADLMGAFDLTIRFEAINLTTVADGPDPVPIVLSPLGAAFGLPWLKLFFVSIGSGHFPAPPNGQPHLYEMNVTADVSGPVPQSFAGYSTWVFDPDTEPAVWPPFIRPPVFPHWQYDIPMRFLVYTP
jgi:hypothetical protein